MSKHITEKQRYAISKMLQVPMSKKDIAEAIGVDRSNLLAELKKRLKISIFLWRKSCASR